METTRIGRARAEPRLAGPFADVPANDARAPRPSSRQLYLDALHFAAAVIGLDDGKP